MKQSQAIFVKRIKGKGRGVFALQPIERGEVFETVPVILVPAEHLIGGMHSTTLTRYFFLWNRNHVAISLGYGSLYNHSYSPNATYRHGNMSISYVALRGIEMNEEITINYNGSPKDKAPVGFEVK
jgi:uncharacterized protein